jgi:hypothetical protein
VPSTSPVTASSSNQSRNSPTVSDATDVNAWASCESMMRRVTSSDSYGITVWVRNSLSGTSASTMRAAMRSWALAAAIPASSSPERAGDAFAKTSLMLLKLCVMPRMVWNKRMTVGRCCLCSRCK